MKPLDRQIDPREVDASLHSSQLTDNAGIDAGIDAGIVTTPLTTPLIDPFNDDLSPITIPTSGQSLTPAERRQGYRLARLQDRYDFRRIALSLVVRDRLTTDGYHPLGEDGFCRLVYNLFPEAQPNDARSLYDKARTMASEFTSLQIIRLGTQVWDATTATLHELDLTPDSASPYSPSAVLWFSPYTPTFKSSAVDRYLLSLANGKPEVVEDIVTSIAVTFLSPKPRGVFWWVGAGRNGKSVLADLIRDYLFPGQVSMIGMPQLESGRGVGEFNGSLMNISAEGLGSGKQVVDATNYKHLGSHESFPVQKLYVDEYLRVRGDVNCIFAVNSFPDFKEKTEAIISRTKTIEFANHFPDQPDFKETTFTPEFVAAFLGKVLTKAQQIYQAGNLITFSETTKATMQDFATDSDPAAAFLLQVPLIGFRSIGDLYPVYTRWHRDQGLTVTLATIPQFASSVRSSRFNHRSVRIGGSVRRFFFLPSVSPDQAKMLIDGNISGIYYQNDQFIEQPKQGDLDALIAEAVREDDAVLQTMDAVQDDQEDQDDIPANW